MSVLACVRLLAYVHACSLLSAELREEEANVMKQKTLKPPKLEKCFYNVIKW